MRKMTFDDLKDKYFSELNELLEFYDLEDIKSKRKNINSIKDLVKYYKIDFLKWLGKNEDDEVGEVEGTVSYFINDVLGYKFEFEIEYDRVEDVLKVFEDFLNEIIE